MVQKSPRSTDPTLACVARDGFEEEGGLPAQWFPQDPVLRNDCENCPIFDEDPAWVVIEVGQEKRRTLLLYCVRRDLSSL